MKTYDNDYTLPAMPLADLQETCENLKAMIKPLVDDETWQEACHELDELRNDGSGSYLQELLLDRCSKQKGNDSWLRPIWDDIYLTYRDRLPCNMNYAIEMIAGKWGENALPLFVCAVTHVLRLLRGGDLPVEMTRAGALSMDTLRYMIYTRIPGEVRDSWYYPNLANPMTASVVCNRQWFILSLEDGEGRMLSSYSVKQALKSITEQARALPSAACVGALTAASRGGASALRAELQQNPLNRLSLESIEKSLFTICLDSTGDNEFTPSLTVGDAAGRWFDKSLQIVSSGNNLGVNIEHSGCDGGIWVYFLTQAAGFIEDGTIAEGEQGAPAHFRLLEWNVPDALASKLNDERSALDALATSVSFCKRRVTSVSRAILKPKKCSPDWFVQMLFQLAYYEVTKRISSIYEAVSTRAFYEGRTECIRPVTECSTALLLAYASGAGDEELRQKFRLAEEEHMRGIKRCQNALGPERHMTGLQYIYEMYAGTSLLENLDMPAIFKTTGYLTLKHDAVSTSSSTAPSIDFFSFCPVVSDGIGIGYGLKQDALHIAISAYDKSGVDTSEYMDALERAAVRMLEVI